ncbi:Mucolipin-3 [Exaiptasia diaphana]|nr:Mucolipin-3 [Exaiptasia diaphana]
MKKYQKKTFGCIDLPKPKNGEHIISNTSFQFGSLVSLELILTLNAINLKGVRSWDKPSCYALDVKILFDNSKLDGQMPLSLTSQHRWLKCKKRAEINSPEKDLGRLILVGLLVFDAIVIFICLLSLILCLRSLAKSFHLAKEARTYFKDFTNDPLTLSEAAELFNLWFIVIIISDFLAILGSIYKIAIEQKSLYQILI